MKNLEKIFLLIGIVAGVLVSTKIIIELYDTKVKKYINVY